VDNAESIDSQMTINSRREDRLTQPEVSAPVHNATEGSTPLGGVRIVELATVLMAPLGIQVLADLGADVVKIESSRVDPLRFTGPEVAAGLSDVALNLHRNKKSAYLEVRTPQGRAVLSGLIKTADVFVTNLRPNALTRLGVDYDSVRRLNPTIIYCESHGYRSDSPEAERPAYDDTIQAEAGLTTLMSHAGKEPAFFPSALVDKVCALYIVQGILAAMFARSQTGLGQRVEVPMYDTMLAFNLVEHLSQAVYPGKVPGYARVLSPHRGPYKTADSYVVIMPYSDNDWRDLYRAVDREEELNHPSFANVVSRHADTKHVYGSLARLLRGRTTEEWLNLCEELGIAVGSVHDLESIVEDPLLHRGVLSEVEHPLVGRYRHIKYPLRFNGERVPLRRVAPIVGQDTCEILTDLGMTAADIDQLLADGIAVQAEPFPISSRLETSSASRES